MNRTHAARSREPAPRLRRASEVVRGLSLLARARRDRLPARAERLRQDHGAALHRRLRGACSEGEIRLNGTRGLRRRRDACRRRSGASAWCSRTTRCSRTSRSRRTSPSACTAAPQASARRACASSPSWSASSASLDKYPHEISGGQQQRVALARALAPRPELLLLDEPFSNLDVDLRERLSLEVRDIIKASGATAMLVTHDQHEAFAMADEIGIMHEGRIQQWDSAVQPLPPPGEPLRRRLRRPGRVPAGDGAQRAASSRSSSACCSGDCRTAGGSLDVLLRPDDVVHDDAAPTQAEVVHKAFRGAEILYTLRLRERPQGARAGAEPPQPRARREHRHPPGRRPRRGVSPRGRSPLCSVLQVEDRPRISSANSLPRSAGGTGTARAALRNIAAPAGRAPRGPSCASRRRPRSRAVGAERHAHAARRPASCCPARRADSACSAAPRRSAAAGTASSAVGIDAARGCGAAARRPRCDGAARLLARRRRDRRRGGHRMRARRLRGGSDAAASATARALRLRARGFGAARLRLRRRLRLAAAAALRRRRRRAARGSHQARDDRRRKLGRAPLRVRQIGKAEQQQRVQRERRERPRSGSTRLLLAGSWSRPICT